MRAIIASDENITTPELISLLRDNIYADLEYENSELNPVYQQAGRMDQR